MLLYYITDRRQFQGTEAERRERLLAKISEAARCGVDLVQLREKDLATCELEFLAHEAIKKIRAAGATTRLLINSRVDVALAVGADGLHLRSRDISPEEVRRIWNLAAGPGTPMIAVSCHTEEEVRVSAQARADYAVFAPIFEKTGTPQLLGLERLRAACRHEIPVLALGGIQVENARSCIQAGAKGIAAIRLFQENQIQELIAELRSLD